MTNDDVAGDDPDQLLLWADRQEVVEAAATTDRSPRADQRDRLWSIEDVGYFLDIPVATIYQWRGRGEAPPAIKLGKHLRFEPDVVRAWVAARSDRT